MTDSGSSAPAGPRAISHPAALSVVVASTFLAMTAYTAPLGNGVTLAAVFGSSPAGLSWILASMSVGLAVSLLPAGVVADRLGRRAVFVLGAGAFALSGIAGAVAWDTSVFVASRILAGIGATGMIATGLGLVSAVPGAGAHQATTATWWSVAMGSGIAVGPVAAGLFDVVDGWWWLYLLLALGGILTGAGALRLFPRDAPAAPGERRRLDVAGLILLIAFLTVLITAIVEVRSGRAATVIVLFAASVVLLAGLVLSQSRGSNRLIRPELLAHRPFQAATLAGFGTGLGVISVMAFSATYLVVELGLTTLEAGVTLAAWSGTSAVAALGFSRVSARTPGPVQLVAGLCGVGAGILLMTGVSAEGGFGRLVVGLAVAGVSSGLLNGGLARQSVATVPPADAATGTAANNTARYLGAAIGVTAASMVVTGAAPADGWNRVVWAAAGVSFLAGITVWRLGRVPRRE